MTAAEAQELAKPKPISAKAAQAMAETALERRLQESLADAFNKIRAVATAGRYECGFFQSDCPAWVADQLRRNGFKVVENASGTSTNYFYWDGEDQVIVSWEKPQ